MAFDAVDLPIDLDTGDLNISDDMALVDGDALIAQRIFVALTTMRREYHYDEDSGVDYDRYVAGKKFRVANLNTAFIPVIKSVDGVHRLAGPIKYTIDRTNRILTMKAEVITVNGVAVTVEAAF